MKPFCQYLMSKTVENNEQQSGTHREQCEQRKRVVADDIHTIFAIAIAILYALLCNLRNRYKTLKKTVTANYFEVHLIENNSPIALATFSPSTKSN